MTRTSGPTTTADDRRSRTLLQRLLCVVSFVAVAVCIIESSYRPWKASEGFLVLEAVSSRPSSNISDEQEANVDFGVGEGTPSVDATIVFWNDLYRQPGGKAWFEAPASWIGPKGIRSCPSEDPDDEAFEFSHSPLLQRGLARPARTQNPKLGTFHCDLTVEKSRLHHADMVIFSGQYSDGLESLRPPPRTRSDQMWVFYATETPVHSPMAREMYGDWNSAFNWTATYRLDSDIPLRYGRVMRRQHLDDTAVIGAAQDEELKTVLEQKEFLVAAIIGNCNPKHMRHRLIKFLKKAGIRVHVYGNCGIQGVCPPWNEDCYSKLAKRYKFFLAAENSFCPDYVTEKMFKGLKNPWIPIVFGGTHYAKFAPAHALIQARLLKDTASTSNDSNLRSSSPRSSDDLSSFDGRRLNPRELVKLIKRLDRNDSEYLSYFRWKQDFTVDYPPDWGCALCRKIVKWKKSAKQPTKTYSDMYEWWEMGSKCRVAV